MADAVTIEVQTRDKAKNKGTGTRYSRRLRKHGRVPAIIYGHKKPNVAISLTREDVAMMLKKSIHSAELRYDGTTELAVVRDVQWDHLGKEIIHLDFYRVDPGEKVEAEVTLELHGQAPGIAQGGRLDQQLRSLKIMAKVGDIPKSIRLEVGEMVIGDSIFVRDLPLPSGVTTEVDPDQLIIQLIERPGQAAEDEVAEPAAEQDKNQQEPGE